MIFLTQLDIKILLLVLQSQSKLLDFFTTILNWITEGGIVWILFCFLILFFGSGDKKRKIILILFSLLLSSWLANTLLKSFFFRPRPFEAIEGIRHLGKVWADSSFPSAHVTSSVAVLLMIIYLFKPKRPLLVFFSIIFISLLGFSRVYAGMHYPSDILAGIFFGAIAAALTVFLDKQINFLGKRN